VYPTGGSSRAISSEWRRHRKCTVAKISPSLRVNGTRRPRPSFSRKRAQSCPPARARLFAPRLRPHSRGAFCFTKTLLTRLRFSGCPFVCRRCPNSQLTARPREVPSHNRRVVWVSPSRDSPVGPAWIRPARGFTFLLRSRLCAIVRQCPTMKSSAPPTLATLPAQSLSPRCSAAESASMIPIRTWLRLSPIGSCDIWSAPDSLS
jgi:hypothetical protein